ncbi:MAG TPA: DUF1289 domain-containing protein [Steroidobacteraceae bacterium]|nr:DUF1289 domain-containing protein [Steroidobacteraceae bacterium]
MARVGPTSPCINVCVLDAVNCCTGCGRTVVEITRWGRMSPDEQWAVIARLERARPDAGRSDLAVAGAAKG